MGGQQLGRGLMVNFNGQLEIETQAAWVDVGGTDLDIIVIRDEQFGVYKRGGLVIDPDAFL